jgi:hypothetical protein
MFLLVVGIVLPAIFLGLVAVVLLDRDAGSSGRIRSPERGQRIGPRFRVEGDLSMIPRGHHVWLAIRDGELLFPSEPEIAAQDGRFTAELTLARIPERPFSLVLALVDARGQRAIEYWLLQGGLGEGYPGFAVIPGCKRLDAVLDLSSRPD